MPVNHKVTVGLLEAYEKLSGFETTGNVEMHLSADEVWDLYEKLISS